MNPLFLFWAMKIDLTHKRALVCGSTQGIGKAIAMNLAQAGAEVVLFARDKAALENVRRELPANEGQKHSCLVADFSKPEEVHESLVEFLREGKPVHVLVNNTGGPTPGLAIDAPISDYRIAFNQHLVNNQLLAQALVPGMKAEKYGRIINIISVSVKTPIQGLGVSNTIRGAVASWAKTLSNELGEFGITVNNILPGLTRTGRLESLIAKRAEEAGKSNEEMEKIMVGNIPLRRFGDPSEPAALAAFLASPLAAFITGTSIRVDGGSTPSV